MHTPVILIARRKNRLEELSKKLSGNYGIKALGVPLDVSKKNEVDRVISSLSAKWCNIDILINNAGVSLSSEKIQDTAT